MGTTKTHRYVHCPHCHHIVTIFLRPVKVLVGQCRHCNDIVAEEKRCIVTVEHGPRCDCESCEDQKRAPYWPHHPDHPEDEGIQTC